MVKLEHRSLDIITELDLLRKCVLHQCTDLAEVKEEVSRRTLQIMTALEE